LDEIGKVNLFKFVVNPNDFAQSVENIFYLSFLIRDAKVAFETEDGEPVICKYPTQELIAIATDFLQMVVKSPPTWTMRVD
jgi:non-structural maintenance of chromosomes element 4